MFPKVPQSFLGILRVPQLPRPLEHLPPKNPTLFWLVVLKVFLQEKHGFPESPPTKWREFLGLGALSPCGKAGLAPCKDPWLQQRSKWMHLPASSSRDLLIDSPKWRFFQRFPFPKVTKVVPNHEVTTWRTWYFSLFPYFLAVKLITVGTPSLRILYSLLTELTPQFASGKSHACSTHPCLSSHTSSTHVLPWKPTTSGWFIDSLAIQLVLVIWEPCSLFFIIEIPTHSR